MSAIVVTSPDKLEELIEAAVRRALASQAKPADYITMREACSTLRCTERHGRRLVASGRLETTKIGRKVLVKRSSVERLLEDGTR